MLLTFHSQEAMDIMGMNDEEKTGKFELVIYILYLVIKQAAST